MLCRLPDRLLLERAVDLEGPWHRLNARNTR